MNQYIAVAIAAGVPFVTILLGMFFNNQRFNGIDRKLDVLEHDLKEFYRILGQVEGRMDSKH